MNYDFRKTIENFGLGIKSKWDIKCKLRKSSTDAPSQPKAACSVDPGADGFSLWNYQLIELAA